MSRQKPPHPLPSEAPSPQGEGYKKKGEKMADKRYINFPDGGGECKGKPRKLSRQKGGAELDRHTQAENLLRKLPENKG